MIDGFTNEDMRFSYCVYAGATQYGLSEASLA